MLWYMKIGTILNDRVAGLGWLALGLRSEFDIWRCGKRAP